MSELRLRHSVRALIVDEDDRVLLCRWDLAGMTVWGTPGGGIEEGESHHVWHQEVIPAQHTVGFDGVMNDFYLVRTSAFEPRVTLFDEQLAPEDLTELRWWPLDEITAYVGNAVFAPRFLAPLLTNLLRTFSNGVPVELLEIGL